MKKTLIAMAAVAVAGVASAQVTVSGQLAYAWESTSSADAVSVDTNGLAVTDGNLTFRASEDLGGGMSISTSQEFVARGRDTAMSGRNATISLSGFKFFWTVGALPKHVEFSKGSETCRYSPSDFLSVVMVFRDQSS